MVTQYIYGKGIRPKSNQEAGAQADHLTTVLALIGPVAALAVAGILTFRRRARFGLATACIGGGQGIAMVLESLPA